LRIKESGSQKRLVVIGNGMAGVAAVEQVLKIRKDFNIIIFGEEPHVNYNRILLSDVLAGKYSKDKIYLNTRQWYEENQIDLRTGLKIKAIEPASKTVVDASGKVTSYGKLLIAIGGRPVIPPIQGVDKNGVFVFRNLQDTQEILQCAPEVKNAVVIGGGLLGLEAARAMTHHGLSVTVVHLMTHLMEQQLDLTAGNILRREIERMGIRVMLNATAIKIFGDDHPEGVQLKDGHKIPAEMVLICAGIRPDLELANSAGLQTNKGIVVNDQLQTSFPDIYAVGDVIEHREKIYGLVAPLHDQAKVVADQLVGDKKLQYEGTVCATTLKVAGIKLTSAGVFEEKPVQETVVYMDTQSAVYKKLVFDQNRLVGMILLGDNQDGQRLFQIINSQEDVSATKSEVEQMILKQPGIKTSPGLSILDQMPDSEVVCNCHSVTKGTILSAIRGKGIKTRGGIAADTQATTGCGSCTQLVEDLLSNSDKVKTELKPVSQKNQTFPLEPVLEEKPTLGYPEVYPKSLNLERIKQEGLGLDFERIRQKGVMALTEDDYYRLKTYGVCSQKHPGYFMVRIRIPGGFLNVRQLMGLADLADIHGRGRAHFTTRQNLELHWVRVEEVPEIWEKLGAIGLSTRSACGHTLRNVVACPHGNISEEGILDVLPFAKAISDHFIQRSDWINPKMPNRLNIYLAGCPQCAPDVQINDIGFVAVKRPGGHDLEEETGFEVWAGGSLGAHPILGIKLSDFISKEDVLAACQTIFYLHTQYGNRNKAKSRLKWLLDQWGPVKFTKAFEKVFEKKRTLPENKLLMESLSERGGSIPGPHIKLKPNFTLSYDPFSLPPGCYPQKQRGYVWMKAGAPLGEFRSDQLRELGKISKRFGNGEIYLTTEQAAELHWVRTDKMKKALRTLEKNELRPIAEAAGPKLLACPGTEFCVLAVTNAQGAAREILRNYQPNGSEKADLLKKISIHISGCPNSCAKHQVADIGLAGTFSSQEDGSRFSYLLFLGGAMENGVRLGQMVRKGITEDQLIPEIDALLDIILDNGKPDEPFRDVVERMGPSTFANLLESKWNSSKSESFKPVPMELDLAEV